MGPNRLGTTRTSDLPQNHQEADGFGDYEEEAR